MNSEEQPPLKKQKTAHSSSTNKKMTSNGAVSNGVGDAQPVAQRMHEDHDHGSFDTDLYSRQLYTLGDQAMRRLRTSAVLISGINGVGVEIAKNLILGGVRHVTIHDTEPTTWHDLSAQYYLSDKNIGQNRAEAAHNALAELNDTVTVLLNTQPLSEAFVDKFDLTILCGYALPQQLEVNAWTRKVQKKMIVADTRGLFGMVFNDFGAEFEIADVNGEQAQEVMIEHIDKATGDVTTLEEAKHGLEDGDYVRFSEVKGMLEVNHAEPMKVKVIKPTKFSVGPDALSSMSQYTEGGVAIQVKMPKTVKFASLADSLKSPEFLISDFAKMERPGQMHVLWQAVNAFVTKKQRMPAPRCQSDAAQVLELAASIDADVTKDIPKQLADEFSYQSTGNLCPMTSFIGGVAAHEAMKAVTGVHTPIQQWLYFDALECLPTDWCKQFDAAKLTESECAPKNTRYDGSAAVFGWPFVNYMHNQKWFIVGAGAIGCELLKNLAMMGVGTSGQGQLMVTDMDQIETSNLNRQFLFRRHDVGSKKSECAANAVQHFNSDVKIKALAERVCGETEHIFSDAFFTQLNGVANALDNVEARRYVDRRCVYYKLPLLESGTMGPKCNTQVVYPHMTESYSSSSDPPEKSIPICTLKHFPNAIEHTIQWGRDMFEGKFTYPAEQANKWLEDPRAFAANAERMNSGQRLEVYTDAKRALIDERPKSAEDCVRWARDLFEHEFHNEIAQLLHNFPPEQLTENGAKFWSGAKRCPRVVNFDVNDPTHFEFIYAASILRAELYDVKPILDREQVTKLASSHQPPPFKAKDNVRIAVTDAEAQEQQNTNSDSIMDGTDIDQQVQAVMLSLARERPERNAHLTPIDFEKDDDTNHHVDFITAASNLRADNYSITRADRLKTKQVAGRIIPAIATTTAAVSGLVCLEMYKMIAAGPCKHPIPMEAFKNAFCNLALPFFAFSEPIAAPKKPFKLNDEQEEITLWDCIEITSAEVKSLDDLIKYLDSKYNLEVTMLSSGVSLLYSFFLAADKKAARLKMSIPELVTTVSQSAIPDHVKALTLEVMASDKETDEDVETPYIRFSF